MELEAIRSGDPEAFGRLLREAWAPLVRYLASLLDSVEAAEDAAQEAFVRLWEHRDRWRSGSPRAVVFRIGRNVALDLKRGDKVRRRWRQKHRADQIRSPSTPDEELACKEALQRFQEALESLPPRRREVFELIRLRGLSHQEAAEVLDISYRTVANHLFLAMKDIQDMLSDFPSQSSQEEGVSGEDRSPKERSNHG